MPTVMVQEFDTWNWSKDIDSQEKPIILNVLSTDHFYSDMAK